MDARELVDALREHGVTFYSGVPDSFLNGFCREIYGDLQTGRNVICANEGNAIAVAVGHYLATGEVPLVYMQNSGVGNAVNPLASLSNREMLSIPMVLLIGWRGDPLHQDHVQHALQGRATVPLLDALEIESGVLDEGSWQEAVRWAVDRARETSSPVALLVPKGVLVGAKKPFDPDAAFMSREAAIRVIAESAPDGAVFCATTGRAAREFYHVREELGQGHGRDYLNVGSMGHVSSVAYGIALAKPDVPVICLDGDGALIMHMGFMAAQATRPVGNLLHVVLNNRLHESVGGQPTAAGLVNFTAIAAACGYRTLGDPVSHEATLRSIVGEFKAELAPMFVDVDVRPGIRADLPPLEVDPAGMKSDLMASLAK